MLDNLLIKAFIPEFFLTLAIIFQLIFNIYNITNIKHNFPFMDKEILFQLFFILFIVLLLFSNVHIYGLFSNYILINDVSAVNIKILLTIIAALSLIFIWQSFIVQNVNFFEFFTIYLIVILASLLFISCFDFLSVYLVLELQALCFYILAGIKRNSSFSLESALKYFIAGSYFSCVYIFAVLLIYSEYSITNFYDLLILIDATPLLAHNDINWIVCLSFFFIIITLFFKLAVVPFQFWVPDVYDGAPLATTILLSVLPKLALFTFLIRFLIINYNFLNDLLFIFLFCGLLSLAWGTYSALKQKRFKKLLIFSSIAQVGLLMIALSTFTIENITACFFYLVIYLISAVIGWSSITTMYVTGKSWAFQNKNFKFSTYLTNLINLFDGNKTWALIFIIYMFSLAGMPPFAGFLSKFYILLALINTSSITLVILVLLITSISAFYYIRLVKIILFEIKNNSQINHDFMGSVNYSQKTSSSLITWLCVLSLILIFLFPNFFLEYCKEITVGFFKI